MKVNAIVQIRTIHAEVPWEIQHSWDQLRYKMKKHITRKVWDGNEYKVDYNGDLYQECLNLQRKYPDEIQVAVDFQVKYTQQELDRAVAFIPCFKSIRVKEYNDMDTFDYFCESCANSNLKTSLFLNPGNQSKLNTFMEKESTLCAGDGVSLIYGISRKLYEELIKQNFYEKNFIPIASKKQDNPFAYSFSSDEVIELYNDSYDFSDICKSCNTVHAEQKRDGYVYTEFYINKDIDFQETDVYFSEQYYEGERMILLSPRMYKEIKNRCKEAKFVPVFFR